MRARIRGLLVGAVLAACPAEDGGDASDESSTTTTAPMGEFDTRIQPILDDSCSCHLTTVGSGGLGLLGGMAYDNLVGVPSAGAPMFTRVVVGDADASYLVAKLEGTHLELGGLGAPMPIDDELSQDIIDEIRAWIDEGAPE